MSIKQAKIRSDRINRLFKKGDQVNLSGVGAGQIVRIDFDWMLVWIMLDPRRKGHLSPHALNEPQLGHYFDLQWRKRK